MRRSSRGVIDQSEQQVFSSHVVVVEALGLLAGKRQDLLGTWSKIIHHCVPDAGTRRMTLLKVATTSADHHLTSKLKEIEYCYEHQSSFFMGYLTQSAKPNPHRMAPKLLVHR